MGQDLKQAAAALLQFALEANPGEGWDSPGITARVTGDHLDNVMGVSQHYQNHELVATLEGDPEDGLLCRFNLAPLLALATIGAKTLLSDETAAPNPRTHLNSFDPLSRRRK